MNTREASAAMTVGWNQHRVRRRSENTAGSQPCIAGSWQRARDGKHIPGSKANGTFRSCAAWQCFSFTSLSADHLHSNWSGAQSSCSYPWQIHGLNKGWLQNSIIYTFVCITPHKPVAIVIIANSDFIPSKKTTGEWSNFPLFPLFSCQFWHPVIIRYCK